MQVYQGASVLLQRGHFAGMILIVRFGSVLEYLIESVAIPALILTMGLQTSPVAEGSRSKSINPVWSDLDAWPCMMAMNQVGRTPSEMELLLWSHHRLQRYCRLLEAFFKSCPSRSLSSLVGLQGSGSLASMWLVESIDEKSEYSTLTR